jgi:hypothetical protein
VRKGGRPLELVGPDEDRGKAAAPVAVPPSLLDAMALILGHPAE